MTSPSAVSAPRGLAGEVVAGDLAVEDQPEPIPHERLVVNHEHAQRSTRVVGSRIRTVGFRRSFHDGVYGLEACSIGSPSRGAVERSSAVE